MIKVSVSHCQRIIEHGRCLVKRDAVFVPIPISIVRIPLEFHRVIVSRFQ